jgi:hypothetical protein
MLFFYSSSSLSYKETLNVNLTTDCLFCYDLLKFLFVFQLLYMHYLVSFIKKFVIELIHVLMEAVLISL